MYVYIKSESARILNIPGAADLYTVGFYKPDGEWEPESDHSTTEEAAKRVHYLNGGTKASNKLAEHLPEIVEGLKGVFCAIELDDACEASDHFFQIPPPYQAPAVHESACERLWAMLETLTGEAFCPYADRGIKHDNCSWCMGQGR